MGWFRNASLRTKLTLILLVVVTVVALLSGLAVLPYDVTVLKAAMVDQISTLTAVLGEQSTAALEFKVPGTAQEILASLRLEPTVKFACIYDTDGQIFATYTTPEYLTGPASAPPLGHSFTPEGNLEITREIRHGERLVGAIFVRASMERLDDQVRRQVLARFVGLLVALAASALLVALLQRIIVRPILHLAGFTKTISAQADYSLRVQKQSNDELGVLYDSVNTMLAQIQGRDADLVRSEERFRLTVESALDAVITMDDQGRISGWNPHAEKTFGWSHAEAIGRSLADTIIPPRYRDAHRNGLELFLKTGKGAVLNQRLELTALRRSGEEFAVELAILPLKLQTSYQFGAFVRDITERKRAEQRFRLAVEAAPNAMIMVDAEGAIVLVNDQTEKVFGYARSELLGRPIDTLVPERVRRASDVAAGAAGTGSFGMGSGREFWGLRKDGSKFPMEIGLNPIETDQGTVVLMAIIDITERKRAEEAVRRAHDELEQRVQERTRDLNATTQELARSNTELEQFAYIASHDLQEPLRKVQAFGDMLVTQYRDALGEEGRDYLQRMQNASKRMQTLITDLLTFSRVTTKGQPFELVDLGQVIDQVLQDLEVRIRDTGGHVEVGTLPTLEADPVQMRQLLQNLIGNALKFHQKGVPPVVKLHGHVVEPDPATFPHWTAGVEYWEFTFEDNGIGFDEKYLDRIFTPFQRLHGRGEYEGTGIGLAICRKIVERHAGTITAHSAPGRGATFLITLPARQLAGGNANA